jgi:hypothetical protein
MSVRAKFRVNSIEDVTGYNAPGKNINLQVVGEEGEPHKWDENKSFFNSTPIGSINLHCINPKANEQFEVGKYFYVDFTPAE